MKQINQLLSGFMAFAFLVTNTGMPVYAQTASTTAGAAGNTANGTGQVINGLENIVSSFSTAPSVFNQTPQQFQTAQAQAQMQRDMTACVTKSLAAMTGSSTTASSAKTLLEQEFKSILNTKSAKAKGVDLAKGTACYTSKDVCAADCAEPEDTSPDCDPSKISSLEGGKQTIKAYIAYLGQKAKCSNKDYDALKTQKDIMDCQMAVLQAGIQQAGVALGTALSANKAQFNQMSQYQGELGSQMTQISALVGGTTPDGKEMPGKWTELQKSLYDNFNQMTDNEANFKNDSNSYDEQVKQNAAFLTATKAQKFGACMFGSTASTGAVQCWRPKATYTTNAQGQSQVSGMQKNKNGCPVFEKGLCSPAQAARSAIEMSYLTSGGQPYQDADRCNDAETAATNFDNVMNDISGKLGTDLSNWDDIQKAYGSQINSTAMNYLQNGASACTTNANNWANNAQNPNKAKMDKESQQYAEQNTKLKAMQVTLSGKLDSGLTGLNKAYGDVMAALSDQPVSLNTVQCTKDNPTTMQKCYADIRSNLKTLLQGSGPGTTTTKTIKGGTMVPGFAAPCNGLDGCITTYRTIRDKLNDQMTLATQAKQKYVAAGNQQVDAQTAAFASFLNGTQSTILKQYDQMKAAFMAMGITPPDSPKRLEAANFKPFEDKSGGGDGPYQDEGNLSNILSGKVAGGLINTGDTGMKDSFAEALEAVKTKKSGQSDKIKDWQDKLKDFNTAAKTCSDGKNKPVLDTMSCSSCSLQKGACIDKIKSEAIPAGTDLAKTLNLVFASAKALKNGGTVNYGKGTELDDIYGSVSAECRQVLDTCDQCFASGKQMSGGATLGESGPVQKANN